MSCHLEEFKLDRRERRIDASLVVLLFVIGFADNQISSFNNAPRWYTVRWLRNRVIVVDLSIVSFMSPGGKALSCLADDADVNVVIVVTRFCVMRYMLKGRGC